MEHFDYIVLGDEPAGLWLFSKMSRVFLQDGVSRRLAWLAFGQPNAVAVPSYILSHYGIDSLPKWSAEIVSKNMNCAWEKKALAHQFKQLGALLSPEELSLMPREAQLALVRKALIRYPELLTLCNALWKFIGRTQNLQPEHIVLSGLHATQLSWWNPGETFPQEVERIWVGSNALEDIKRISHGKFQIKFQDQEPITTDYLVLNTPLFRLLPLLSKKTGLTEWLSIDETILAPTALYPLTVRVKKDGVPVPVRPLTLLMDNDEIPEPETELWPIQLASDGEAKELCIWVTGARAISLEAIVDAYKQGFKRLNQLFPFLNGNMIEVGSPLYLDTCFGDLERARAMEAMENSQVEIYRNTLLRMSTLNSKLFNLCPVLDCHLPYPLGPLKSARSLLLDFMAGVRTTRPIEKIALHEYI